MQKMDVVTQDEELREKWIQELDKRNFVWSKNGCKINGRAVSKSKFTNGQKMVAALIYDKHHQ
jgi:hypothetical protein